VQEAADYRLQLPPAFALWVLRCTLGKLFNRLRHTFAHWVIAETDPKQMPVQKVLGYSFNSPHFRG
jgi:hypothetical protein